MKTVIATADGSIQSNATARARRIEFKKGGEVTLPDEQADFLVSCGKAKEIKVEKKVEEKLPLTAEVVKSLSAQEIADRYNMKELRAYAKEAQVENYSTLNQADLVTAMKNID